MEYLFGMPDESGRNIAFSAGFESGSLIQIPQLGNHTDLDMSRQSGIDDMLKIFDDINRASTPINRMPQLHRLNTSYVLPHHSMEAQSAPVVNAMMPWPYTPTINLRVGSPFPASTCSGPLSPAATDFHFNSAPSTPQDISNNDLGIIRHGFVQHGLQDHSNALQKQMGPHIMDNTPNAMSIGTSAIMQHDYGHDHNLSVNGLSFDNNLSFQKLGVKFNDHLRCMSVSPVNMTCISSPNHVIERTGWCQPMYPTFIDDMSEDSEQEEAIALAVRQSTQEALITPPKTPAKRAGGAKRPRGVSFTTPTAKKGSKSGAPRSIGRGYQILKCEVCHQSFKGKLDLQTHTNAEHSRTYICVFHWAGCTSTFASKNEWKRHVITQHLALRIWICTEDSCSTVKNAGNSCPDGAIFNRKDLYTQHVRRMHVPDRYRSAVNAKKPHREWDNILAEKQRHAEKERCKLPITMTCPYSSCDNVFTGPNTWDERMEHIAKHLERAAAGQEQQIILGGLNDPTLTLWAQKAGVVRQVTKSDGSEIWGLREPLKMKMPAGSKGSKGMKATHAESDADDPEVVTVEGVGI